MAGFDIDFGALKTPDYLGSALSHYDYGRQRRKEQDAEEALRVYDTDPLAAITMARRSDPRLARDLRKDYDATQEIETRKAIGAKALTDPTGATNDALNAGQYDTAAEIAKLTGDARKAARERAELFAQIGYGLKKQPYETRKAILERSKAGLVEMGLPESEIDAFDPTDEALDGIITQGMSLADQLAEENRQRDDERAQQREDEMRQYRDEMLGIRQEQLGLAKSREGRVAARAAGGGGGRPRSAPKLPTGFILD